MLTSSTFMLRSPNCELPDNEGYENDDPCTKTIPHEHDCPGLEQSLSTLSSTCGADLRGKREDISDVQ